MRTRCGLEGIVTINRESEMKRTEKFNIGGFAFTVEEDAAALLKEYTGSIASEFEKDASSGEICADIEERIGELLSEQCGKERLVTVEMVERVKTVMGEFGKDPFPGEGDNVEELVRPGRKRLFRDIDRRFLGGVFSGFAAYFDIDVVIFRICYSLLLLLSIFIDAGWCENAGPILILAYFALWICIPAAGTVEQKCQMTGKPIAVSEFKGKAQPQSQPSGTPPAVHTLGRILLVILGIWLVLSGCGNLVGCGCMDMIRHAALVSVDDPEALRVVSMVFNGNTLVFLILAIAFLSFWKIYAGALLIFNLKAPKWRPGLILFVLFLISAIFFVVFLMRGALSVPQFFQVP